MIFNKKFALKNPTKLTFILIIAVSACVDRLYIDIADSLDYSVSIYGFISDQQGPYQVQVNRSFDIESKISPRIPISVKGIVLSDDLGNKESFHEVSQGLYETSANGMRGITGRMYKITVELLDGRIYESKPDMLYAGGKIDSLYYDFIAEQTESTNTQYGFDVKINSSSANSGHGRFLWSLRVHLRRLQILRIIIKFVNTIKVNAILCHYVLALLMLEPELH